MCSRIGNAKQLDIWQSSNAQPGGILSGPSIQKQQVGRGMGFVSILTPRPRVYQGTRNFSWCEKSRNVMLEPSEKPYSPQSDSQRETNTAHDQKANAKLASRNEFHTQWASMTRAQRVQELLEPDWHEATMQQCQPLPVSPKITTVETSCCKFQELHKTTATTLNCH